MVTTQAQAENSSAWHQSLQTPQTPNLLDRAWNPFRGKEELAKQAREAQEEGPKAEAEGLSGFRLCGLGCGVRVQDFGLCTGIVNLCSTLASGGLLELVVADGWGLPVFGEVFEARGGRKVESSVRVVACSIASSSNFAA